MSLSSVCPIGNEGFDMTVFNRCLLEMICSLRLSRKLFEGEDN